MEPILRVVEAVRETPFPLPLPLLSRQNFGMGMLHSSYLGHWGGMGNVLCRRVITRMSIAWGTWWGESTMCPSLSCGRLLRVIDSSKLLEEIYYDISCDR